MLAVVTVRSRRRLPSTKDVRIHGGVAVAVDYGEQKQAVGRSRGGRNTKIHALADAKGRLLAILLTGGEAHDCPEQIEGLQAHRNSLRQAGAKLPGLSASPPLSYGGFNPISAGRHHFNGLSGLQASIITCGHVSSRAGAGSPCATIGPESATRTTGDCRLP